MCGGNFCQQCRDLRKCGLSPRVRGKPYQTRSGTSEGRSIPACAGETHPIPPVYGLRQVYPRVCGGNSYPSCLRTCHQVYPRVCGGNCHMPTGPSIYTGLSPRVRGKRAGARSSESLLGSIPACAGETLPDRKLL